MKSVFFNSLPEANKNEIIRNLMGIGLNDNDYDEELYDTYMDIMSNRNDAFGGFSDDFIKKNKLKPAIYKAFLNLVEEPETNTKADNDAWFKKFGINAKYTGNKDQSGPEYELSSHDRNALERLLVNYAAQSEPDFDMNKDYGDLSSADDSTADWITHMIHAEEDINSDGDIDLQVADTNGNGKPDTAIVTADSNAEEKEAVKRAKEELGLDNKDKTSTGKTKEELGDETVSDEKQKNKKHPADCTCFECEKKRQQTLSDIRQKNVLSALIDRRF